MPRRLSTAETARRRHEIMTTDIAQDRELTLQFLAESEELLQGVDQDLVALEASPRDVELLNRIFRAVHTIKGTSSFLGHDSIVRLSHRAEDLLGSLRNGDCLATRSVIDALLATVDWLRRMLAGIRENSPGPYHLEPLLARLEELKKPPDLAPRLGDVLVARGVISPQQLKDSLRQSRVERRRLGDVLVEKKLVSPQEIGEALIQQKQASAPEAAALSVHVPVTQLDLMLQLAEELVRERRRLTELLATHGDLRHSLALIGCISEEMRAAVLEARRAPLDTLFGKFPRMLRDLARALGKEVEVEIMGGDIGLDRVQLEQIGAPLVHLARNALDHGIEEPEVRAAAGKPRHGLVRLEARDCCDHVEISVSDDGAGIDLRRVAAKAIESGLITPRQAEIMAPRQLIEMVFLPGFSTAPALTSVSGRGVGMDVVRCNLQKLRGTVELDTRVGEGTNVVLKLPRRVSQPMQVAAQPAAAIAGAAN